MGRGVSDGAARGGARKEGPALSAAALVQGLDPLSSRRVAPSLPCRVLGLPWRGRKRVCSLRPGGH